MGRPKKTAEELEVLGAFEKDPKRRAGREPKDVPKDVFNLPLAPPTWMTRGGKKIWREIVPPAVADGILLDMSVSTLASACELEAAYRANPSQMGAARLNTKLRLWRKIEEAQTRTRRVTKQKGKRVDPAEKYFDDVDDDTDVPN